MTPISAMIYPMYDNTDEELVELAKEGDSEAFNILVRRHVDHIYNFVRQYTTHKEDADDITQEAFFKAWKHIKSFKKGKKFTTWLFTIARNSALDNIKKRKAFSFSDMDAFGQSGSAGGSGGNSSENTGFAETLKDPEPLAPEIFERKELAHELTEAMDTLPPDWKAVLVMHYTDDMTFEEIAAVVSRPMNTIKSWHHRAVLKIRDILATHHKDETSRINTK